MQIHGENFKVFIFTICSNVIVQGLTILAPVTSPNTDGINPGMQGNPHKLRCELSLEWHCETP